MSKTNFYKQALKAASDGQPDFEKAALLLDKAERSGSPEALFAKGNWYFHGRYFKRNVAKAIKYWIRGAKAGNIDSMLELGTLYERGEHLEANLDLAFCYYLQAALAGNGKACYEVSRFFYYGFYVPKNRRASNLWRNKAEELGFEETDDE